MQRRDSTFFLTSANNPAKRYLIEKKAASVDFQKSSTNLSQTYAKKMLHLLFKDELFESTMLLPPYQIYSLSTEGVDIFKEDINESVSSKNTNSWCEVVKSFFGASVDYKGEIDECREEMMKQKKGISLYVAWLAKHNDNKALRNENFLHIFNSNYPFNQSYRGESPITIAIAFKSTDFMKAMFEMGLFNTVDVKIARHMALMLNDEEMMGIINEYALQDNMQKLIYSFFKNSFTNRISNIIFDYMETNSRQEPMKIR